MEGLWFKECKQGRRFIIKVPPGEALLARLTEFSVAAGVTHAVVVSAVGSVRDLRFRGIKTGAKLPITGPRMQLHEVEGPLELLGLSGNIFPDEEGKPDCHLHILAGKSSGEVVGGHLFDAHVFASCELVLSEIEAEGVGRQLSGTAGIPTLFIEQG